MRPPRAPYLFGANALKTSFLQCCVDHRPSLGAEEDCITSWSYNPLSGNTRCGYPYHVRSACLWLDQGLGFIASDVSKAVVSDPAQVGSIPSEADLLLSSCFRCLDRYTPLSPAKCDPRDRQLAITTALAPKNSWLMHGAASADLPS